MVQVHSMDPLLIVTPAAEPGQALVTERLFFITGGVQGKLEAGIEHQVINHFVIRIIKHHFDGLSSNDHTDWSIWPGR